MSYPGEGPLKNHQNTTNYGEYLETTVASTKRAIHNSASNFVNIDNLAEDVLVLTSKDGNFKSWKQITE